MPMTLEQYINNPMGKNNAVLPAFTREAIRRNYTTRFNNLLLRENGKIDYYLYKNSKTNTFYGHIKIPSEVVPKFYYDTIIKLYTDSNIKGLGKSLDYYFVELFSNDPSFVFNYTHTFIKNGLFAKEFSPKMSKEALKQSAKVKNPQDINGYVKSIYFAYLFMKQRGLLKSVRFGAAEEFDIKIALKRIQHADIVIKERQGEGKKISKKKKVMVDKNTLSNISNIGISDKSAERLVTTTNKTSSVKNSKRLNNKKSTKYTTKTKRI